MQGNAPGLSDAHVKALAAASGRRGRPVVWTSVYEEDGESDDEVGKNDEGLSGAPPLDAERVSYKENEA